jgi:hypothetical protein
MRETDCPDEKICSFRVREMHDVVVLGLGLLRVICYIYFIDHVMQQLWRRRLISMVVTGFPTFFAGLYKLYWVLIMFY